MTGSPSCANQSKSTGCLRKLNRGDEDGCCREALLGCCLEGQHPQGPAVIAHLKPFRSNRVGPVRGG